MTKFLKILIFLLACPQLYSQADRLEKRIYLVDVTGSMVGKGSVKTPNIFADVKKELASAINAIENNDTEIVIITFTNKPRSVRSFLSGDKPEILDYIQMLKIESGNTNIADAWALGTQHLDSTKVNYLFLLTDGLHNCGPGKEVLYKHMRDWHTMADNKYYFAFYLLLSPQAREQKVAQIIDESKQIWLIESMDVKASFIKTDLIRTANIRYNKNVNIRFSSNNNDLFNADFTIQLENNPYYTLSNIQKHFEKNSVNISFDVIEQLPILEMPISTDLKLSILYDKERYPLLFFKPEPIDFKIENHGDRKMTIKRQYS